MSNILLAVSGGIAAYKSVELCRRLQDQGHEVRVVMTASAMEFVTPLTFQAISGHPVHTELFDLAAEAAMGHIELARWADTVLIAPATANTLAKLVAGFSDDLLTTVVTATAAPVVVAPAMNQQMYQASTTQENLATLKQRGVRVIGPAAGAQACGEVGMGRMVEPELIVDQLFYPHSELLAGQHWVITAGPTREQIDPVRFLSNNSSGKMGYAIAKAAHRLGAKVTLVSGPVSLLPEAGVTCVKVKSALQMQQAVMEHIPAADVFVACAAVADYRPVDFVTQKIKKNDEHLQIQLVKNPDILQGVAALPSPPFCVGFAAETERLEHYAKDKLQRKNLDLICANNVSCNTIGFDSDENAVTVFSRDGESVTLPQSCKSKIADQLVRLINKTMS
ncbi:MAG: bifunctional phosphopantothenoylcysteine decarboxylase/phosphopantothenate--cysteine ligase CoaBC [Gammaproteobacteria bacterium]|nr:bifunctional phosphopantothenoylcysteine decarboxylase/phosphopantothenate--cysteine ligase CoaBC [Gammaproteobacteria bacterium]NVK88479.1 bifunctional phosphopantothenoylcysteine decarboxylase/phosphopantothenate--cysteine ligase CoaBC [Gammaproteobacteria bacterium]